MTVVLLAGGESTRFWPLREKCTFRFLGKPLLEWHYAQIEWLGMKTVVVVTNNKNHAVVSAIPYPKGLTVSYAVQKGNGMGRAVLALDKGTLEQELLILNASDYYADEFLREFLKKVKEKKEIRLGAVQVSSYLPGGYLRLDKTGSVEEIIEKPKEGTEPSNIVRIVADYFPSGQVFAHDLSQYGKDPINGYETAINMLIRKGNTCRAEIAPGDSWRCLKYPWDVLSVHEMLFCSLKGQRIHDSVHIGEHVIIQGPVVIEEGVKIFEGTKIAGPVFIGKHTIIGNNNLIRGSHIGSQCVTGFHTDITRSYVGNNCWFHSNFIGDSVLSDNVSLGSGTVLANLRLDEEVIYSVVKGQRVSTGRSKLGSVIGENVRIGINANVMPGVKIGSNSFIGAGSILKEDIPDNKFVTMGASGLTVKENTRTASSSREEFRNAL